MSLNCIANNIEIENENKKTENIIVGDFKEHCNGTGLGALEQAWEYYSKLNYLEKSIIRCHKSKNHKLNFLGFLERVKSYTPSMGIADTVGKLMLIDKINSELGNIFEKQEKLLKYKLNYEDLNMEDNK